MKSNLNFFKLNTTTILLILILIAALFLRGYKAVENFGYGHDADLYSWIVKDVVIDKHLRLIGQETSTAGIYIGPLFYYCLIPFYLITNMDPTGAIGFAVAIGVLTVFSYYLVFKKLFDSLTGLVAAFLQAFLTIRIGYDRWIVPTILVNIWCIWYLYAIFNLARGNFSVFFLLGILIGLIWHIHVALAPLLILIPLAVVFSKSRPSLKNIFWGLFGVLIPSIPLLLFEIKHGFSQSISFVNSFFLEPVNVYGSSKFDDVIKQAFGENLGFAILILVCGAVLSKYKKISWKNLILLLVWIISMIAFFTLSSKLISEYYFESIKTVLITISVIVLVFLFRFNLLGKIITLLILGYIAFTGINFVLNLPGSQDGYLERKAVVEYIYQDALKNNYPCVAVSYITLPGYDLGYRYFFYLKNMKVNRADKDRPIYTIVSPTSLAPDDIRAHYKMVGVIPPRDPLDITKIDYSCSGGNSNLTDPFFGFNN